MAFGAGKRTLQLLFGLLPAIECGRRGSCQYVASPSSAMIREIRRVRIT
jgi:hypothetical protein